MAITDLDALVAGFQPPEEWLKVAASLEAQGIYESLAYSNGRPGPASTPAAGMAGEALTSLTGQIPYTNPAGGDLGYLARLDASSNERGTIVLYDRLWQQSGIAITTTTAQTVNSVAFPARDRNGSTNGTGVTIALECTTATGNGAAITNTTISYTNEAGTAGRTGTLAPEWPSSAQVGTWVPFALQAGDQGVRSVQTVTLGTSYVSGAVHLVAYRWLGSVGVTANGVEGCKDAVQLGLPRLFDNTVPFMLWLPESVTQARIQGALLFAQG